MTTQSSPLRLRMQQLMRVRNFSPRTIEIYLGAVAKFARFFGRSPDKLGAEEIWKRRPAPIRRSIVTIALCETRRHPVRAEYKPHGARLRATKLFPAS